MSAHPTAPDPVRIGVLLAGGASRRMGRDKRELRLDGLTLLERNLEFLRGLFPVVGLSVRTADQAPAGLPDDVLVIPDETPGSPMGGLAGILARLEEPVFAMAADLISPDPAAVTRVLDAFRDVDVALPVAVEHVEPLHAVYGPKCLPRMRRLLAAGAHSLLDLFPLVRVARVPFDDMAPFFNVNTPADWAEAQRRLGGVPEGATASDAREAGSAPRAPRAPGEPVVLGVVGRPNNGKTTLIEKLIPQLTARGLRVGAVKRVAKFDIDVPGKDSWRHSRAGAEAYAVGSPGKVAFVARQEEATLEEIVARFFGGFDVVICEGYRREAPDVVEVFRTGAGYESMVCEPLEPLALVTDAEIAHPHRFGLDDAAALARFLVERLDLTPHA